MATVGPVLLALGVTVWGGLYHTAWPVAGLAVLLGCRLAMATIPALFSMNVANLPSHPELEKILTNVGYGIIADTG